MNTKELINEINKTFQNYNCKSISMDETVMEIEIANDNLCFTMKANACDKNEELDFSLNGFLSAYFTKEDIEIEIDQFEKLIIPQTIKDEMLQLHYETCIKDRWS